MKGPRSLGLARYEVFAGSAASFLAKEESLEGSAVYFFAKYKIFAPGWPAGG